MTVNCDEVHAISLGDEELDRQYGSIFRLIDAIPARPDSRQIRESLRPLLALLQVQFSCEEQQMDANDYVPAATHRMLHQGLIERLKEITECPSVGRPAFFELRQLLRDWFMGHILSHDMAYCRFRRERRS